MLLMAVLISGYIGAVLIHAFPKVNNKVTQLEKINIEEVLNKIVSISEIVYQHLDEFENEAINSTSKNSCKMHHCSLHLFLKIIMQKRPCKT